ncbi:hypothetical protein BGZ91_000379 [Linnemannia elongata]|nr:hypothetical protein BGZ91_000379 [Linnemannia elongata]
MTNALELPPEIIIKVGFCIPAIVEEPSPNSRVALRAFRPQTFFACFLVSRTWYQSLLPILWYAYCGDSMSRIPNNIIAKYSHHFRILRPALVHPGPLHCTRLTILELDRYETCTYKEHLQLSQLVRENPWLRTLTRTRATSKSMTLEPDDFVGLKSLEVLTLGGWKLGLASVLRDRCPRLRNLRLEAWGVSEDQLAALVGPVSTTGLFSLQLDNVCIGKELTLAISQHSATLQHLRLQSAYFPLDLQAVVEMLVECWQLMSFGIQSMYLFNEDVAEILKSQLWGQRLERLSLGFQTGVNRGEVMDFFHDRSREDSTWRWRHADWKPIAFRAKNADVRAATRVLLEKAFEIVQEMERLQTFEWDGFPFTRTPL